MSESIEARLKALARRAGLAGATPAAVAAALVLCGLVIALAAWRWWPRASAEVPASPAAERTAGGGSLPGAEPGAGGAEPGPGQGAEPGAGPGAGAPGSGATGESGAPTTTVYVHVVGAVRHAGMYALADGARVADAVAAAGGLAGNAAQAGVNLARPVADGEQVAVPTLDEVARGTAPAGGAAPPAGGAVQAGGGGAAGSSAGPVNINTADATALDVLPGVGPSTAQKIVADREANGPFTSPDDLGRVAGIGPKKLEELKPRVSVR